MKFTWFATFRDVTDPACRITDAEQSQLAEIVSKTPNLYKGLIYTPWPVDGLYYDDGPSPQLQIQLYFDDIDALETAVGKTGHLQVLSDPGTLPSMARATVTEQAMLARPFPVEVDPDAEHPFCSYLVHYPGPADDINLWLRHYIDGHTPVMRRFPGIRDVEISTRIDWCSALPWERVNYMQRNKVVFDTVGALKDALASDVMQEMRADLGEFPPYSGANAHFPMRTIQIN